MIEKKTYTFLTIFVAVLVCMIFGLAATATSRGRGIVVQLKASESPDAAVAKTVTLYDNSYALVIGIDDYTNGWPRLSNAVHDAKLVAAELRKKGFEVTFKKNLNSRQLKDAFEKFFVFKGQDPDARLFAWFAGHGHTMDNEGYIVPADAPRPENKSEFKYKALSLRRFGELARQAESKHALAVFDSCFSGTVFSTGRAIPPPAVTRATTFPVREFISSGDAKQEVSDDGRFRKLFIRALEGTEPADSNHDGYLTGSELGMFLADRISNLTKNAQTPRYGKLRDENYDRGDFVFLVASSGSQIDVPAKARKAALSVSSNVSNAVVLLDGVRIGSTPVKNLTVSSGVHRVLVKKSGYESYRTTVRVRSGRHVSLEAILDKTPPPAGNLYVDTRPEDARVRILNIGPKYTRGMALSPGDYHVEVSKNGYKTIDQWVSVSAGEDKYVTFSLLPNAPARVAEGFSLPSSSSPRPGSVYTDPVTGMEFVYVPGGCYQMGQTASEKKWLIKEYGQKKYDNYYNNETPRHRVCVNGFWMAKYEVTRGQFRKFIAATGYETDVEKYGIGWLKKYNWQNAGFPQKDDHPVVNVTWNDAKAFAGWLTRRTGKRFRLPTEAEWEYAARAGTITTWFWGNNPDDACEYANVANKGDNWSPPFSCDDGFQFTAPVGSYKSNPFGLYDMIGNVREWCSDWYGDYPSGSVTDPAAPSSGSNRVYRGGSWFDGPRYCRAAVRNRCHPGRRCSSLGFRLALSPVR